MCPEAPKLFALRIPFLRTGCFVDPFFANLLLLGPFFANLLFCEHGSYVAYLLSSNSFPTKIDTKRIRRIVELSSKTKEKKFSTCITAAIASLSHHFFVSEGYLSKFHWRRFPVFLLPRSSIDSLTDRDEATDPSLGTSGLPLTIKKITIACIKLFYLKINFIKPKTNYNSLNSLSAMD